MTGSPVIVPIVEGDGEVKAVPRLLLRILSEQHGRSDVRIQQPINARGKTKLLKNFEVFLEYAREEQECDAVLVLLDGDEDCPRDLARGLAQYATELNMGFSVAVVCAHREYEAWFVASLDSSGGERIRSKLKLEENTSYGGDIESIASPKRWLRRHMPKGWRYKETEDQRALTAFIDIEHTRQRSRSFRRLCHAVEELLGAIETGKPIVTPKIAR